MSLLPTPVCPSCGQPIEMAVLRERISGYLNMVGRRAGVVCGSCGTRLALDPKRPILLAVVGLAIFVGASFLLRNLPRAPYTLWNLVAAAPLLLTLVYGQAFTRVQLPQTGVRLRVHGDAVDQLAKDLEPYRAKNIAEAAEEEARIEEINAPGRAPWTCTTCSTECPATFDMCWSCRAARSQTVTSNTSLERTRGR